MKDTYLSEEQIDLTDEFLAWVFRNYPHTKILYQDIQSFLVCGLEQEEDGYGMKNVVFMQKMMTYDTQLTTNASPDFDLFPNYFNQVLAVLLHQHKVWEESNKLSGSIMHIGALYLTAVLDFGEKHKELGQHRKLLIRSHPYWTWDNEASYISVGTMGNWKKGIPEHN